MEVFYYVINWNMQTAQLYAFNLVIPPAEEDVKT